MADARETGQVQESGYTRLELRQTIQGSVYNFARRLSEPMRDFARQSGKDQVPATSYPTMDRRGAIFAMAALVGVAAGVASCAPSETPPPAPSGPPPVPSAAPTPTDTPKPSVDTNPPAATSPSPTSPSHSSQSPVAAEKTRTQPLNIEDWPYWAAGIAVGEKTTEELTRIIADFNTRYPSGVSKNELPGKIAELIRDLAKKVPEEKLTPLLRQIHHAHNLALYSRYGPIAKGAAEQALKTVYGSLREIAQTVAKGKQIPKGPLQIFFMEIPCGGISILYAYLSTADRNSILRVAGCNPQDQNNISMINDSMINAAQYQGKILIPFEVQKAQGLDELNEMLVQAKGVIYRRAQEWLNRVYDDIAV